MADHTHATTDAAHDILAAEEFGMPAADPDLHAGPVVIPTDPSELADEPPHDVLAAEEFAMPAPDHPVPGPGLPPAAGRRFPRWAWMPAAWLAAVWIGRRRRR